MPADVVAELRALARRMEAKAARALALRAEAVRQAPAGRGRVELIDRAAAASRAWQCAADMAEGRARALNKTPIPVNKRSRS